MPWITYKLLLRLAYCSGLLLLAFPGRVHADRPIDPPPAHLPADADSERRPGPQRRPPAPTLSELVPDVLPPPRWNAGPAGPVSLDVVALRLPTAARELDECRWVQTGPAIATDRVSASSSAFSPAPRVRTPYEVGLPSQLARLRHAIQPHGPPASR